MEGITGLLLVNRNKCLKLVDLEHPKAQIHYCSLTWSLLESDLVTTTPLVPSKNVIVSWMSLYRCTLMYCQDRACPLTMCHCKLDVTVFKVTITRSDCSA